MIDRVAGMTNAAPRPMTARVAISVEASPESAAATEPAPKMASPTISARRRPKRSPRPPATMSSEAKTREYASVIHCRSVVEAGSTRAKVGSAVLRIVLSMTTIRSDRHMTARIARRCGYPVFSSMI